ncbi:uncharacterized protein [Lepeophtheirus salmonis]|uniref:uncharacterized protein n=1 Tax=Lepeophtheirus salmonis TaxID=72036 RepID=UPI001AE6B7A9|nr:uncharacterized protein LOC121130159 [Lepeophtheirus salmonis]
MECQLVHKRSLSKKLIFFDGVIIKNGVTLNDRITFLIKEDETSKEFMTRVRQGKEKLRVGDIIKFTGSFENENYFIVSDYQFIQRWDNSIKGTFKSVPPKVKEDKAPKVPEIDSESKHKRARIFANWIEETYSFLDNKKDLILDVAGGKGDLSFELSVRKDFKSHVVDPRFDPRNREESYKKWQKKIAKKTGRKIPKSFNTWFDQNFFIKNRDWILGNVKLIVGLHPDEATDSIVDLCLENNINFAIAPCCVFATQNPHRKLTNGTTPNTYELYLEYLQQKSIQNIQVVDLKFGGRNTILYTNHFK